nr:hypothetical protein [Tanacetum cinerariifolium]
EAGNPLKKVECPDDYDSEDKVVSDDNDMTRSLASERNECPKNIGLGVAKNLKKPSQTSRSVPVDPKSFYENSSTYDTPINDKIEKFEYLLIDGQVILVDEAGNPLKKVECPDDYDSEDKVASDDNDMTRSLASERVGFDTQSLLEQLRDSYGNGDYDEDLYDDDMYEGHDLSQEIQAICDNLDIRVRGRKKNRFMFILSSHFVYLPLRK